MANDEITIEEINAQYISNAIRKHASEARNEEELRIRIETLLLTFAKVNKPPARELSSMEMDVDKLMRSSTERMDVLCAI